jgi:tetratricopeptide (TPR) repeat protein
LFSSLKLLFKGWRFPAEAWETGPEKVKEHFQSLSERFGFHVPISEEFLNGHARHGLERHNAPDAAIRLYDFCLSLYPKSVGAYEGLGDAYVQKGINDKAKEFYEKALALDPSDTRIQKKLNGLKHKTSGK